MTNTYTLSNGRIVKASLTNKRIAKKFHNEEHFAYTLTIEVDDKMFKTTFHGSVMDYRHNVRVSKSMIDTALDCVILDYDSYDYNRNLRDFLDEYGYLDGDEERGERIYLACRGTFVALNEMFTREELNELTDMVNKG